MVHARHSAESNRAYYQANKDKIRARRQIQRGVKKPHSIEEMTLEELVSSQETEPRWAKRSGEVSFQEWDHADVWSDPTADAVCG